MPRKPKPDATIKEIMVVEDPAAIRLLFTPKYVEVLELICKEERSVSDVARALDINPGSAHYHLKELERHGLVKLVREEIAGGVVRKYYHKAARSFVVDTRDPVSAPAIAAAGIDEAYKEKLIRSMSFFGYDVPAEKMEEAKQDLMAADARAKAILAEVQHAGLEKAESDRAIVANAYQIAVLLRLTEDRPFLEAARRFGNSFSGRKGAGRGIKNNTHPARANKKVTGERR